LKDHPAPGGGTLRSLKLALVALISMTISSSFAAFKDLPTVRETVLMAVTPIEVAGSFCGRFKKIYG